MVEGVATKRYSREATQAGNQALAKLNPRARRCLRLAEEAARARDDNHVGTEHIVLGLLAGAPDVAAALSEIGITRARFEAQPFDEPGTSPEGPIPLTPRSL